MPHMRKNILHIASFDGNIGDNASHNGFYNRLGRQNQWELALQQKEIRRTYRNYQGTDRWQWDQSLVKEMNASDLTVIGGGNYFELWLEDSSTGTTIDLAPELLKDIKTPFFFHALGCDPNIGVSANTVTRFRTFIETALSHRLCLVSVRNDGSSKYLRHYLGKEIADQVLTTPDPGFFVDPGNASVPEPLRGKRYWVLNLATDRPERRFPGTQGKLDYEGFISEIADFISEACQTWPDLEIVLTPHIYSDLTPIRDVVQALPDTVRRWQVSIAPLLHGMGAEKTLFALYRDAELAIGPRFHANVCPIGLGTPTIGLVTTQKLIDLYEELGIPERTVSGQHPGFHVELLTLAANTLSSHGQVKAQYNALAGKLAIQSDAVYEQLRKLVDGSP